MPKAFPFAIGENMRKSFLILVFVIAALVLYGQESKSLENSITKGLIASGTTDSQKSAQHSYAKYIHSRYKYADSRGKQVIIENSFPKGGLKYLAPSGKEYFYTIFWTRIANNTDRSLELSIEVPADSLNLSSSPDNYLKIVLPSAQMTDDKALLFNYGLKNLNTVLDNKLQNSSSTKRTISSNETSFIYFVTLFKRGLNGTVRAGLSLKDNKLYYRVNDKEIYCGHFNLKNLNFQK